MLKGKFPLESFLGRETPFYYYDLSVLSRALDEVQAQTARNPEYRVHYAVKANSNPVILREIARRGLGADCVSGGGSIFFAGVGKSDPEIRLALESGIGRFNVESAAELEVIDAIASGMGRTAPVSLRVNPDIGAHTHANITTGLAENKFGINYEQLEGVLRMALELPGVEYRGLHFHIGSQILDMLDFVALCNRINSLAERLRTAGLPLGDINVGGGLGINYEHPNHLDVADFKSYFETFRRHLRLPAGTVVHFEPGRSIVAPCGSRASR